MKYLILLAIVYAFYRFSNFKKIDSPTQEEDSQEYTDYEEID